MLFAYQIKSDESSGDGYKYNRLSEIQVQVKQLLAMVTINRTLYVGYGKNEQLQ